MSRSTDQIAADWIARRYAGLKPIEERELAQWLAADPGHARAFADLDATWELLDAVREPVAGQSPNPDALARGKGRLLAWVTPLLAVAAAVWVVAGFGWGQAGGRPLAFEENLATVAGDFQKAALPDGSVVRLNAGSRVHVRYSPEERRVTMLQGEAHFVVAKNPARPFLVEARGVAVCAVGTAFNVRVDNGAVEVLVTEGKVRVDDRGQSRSLLARPTVAGPPVLAAGERVVIPTLPDTSDRLPATAARIASVSADEIARVLAWQDRRVEFVAVPLEVFAAEFNRYNRVRLRIDDPDLAGRRFGGSFRADEPEEFVRLLESRWGVVSERQGDEYILRAAKE